MCCVLVSVAVVRCLLSDAGYCLVVVACCVLFVVAGCSLFDVRWLSCVVRLRVYAVRCVLMYADVGCSLCAGIC